MMIHPVLVLVTLCLYVLGFPSSVVACDGPSGHYSVRDEFTQSYGSDELATVTINDISGPVTLINSDGSSIELRVISSAPSAGELAKHKILVERDGSSLVIHARPSHGLHWKKGQFRQSVELSLPPSIDVRIFDISGHVKIERIDGKLHVNDVSGPVDVASASGSPHIYDVSGSVSISVTGLSLEGLRISNVSGAVNVAVAGVGDAVVDTDDISGRISVQLPEATVSGGLSDGSYHGKIGRGGVPISISDVSGSVTIRSR